MHLVGDLSPNSFRNDFLLSENPVCAFADRRRDEKIVARYCCSDHAFIVSVKVNNVQQVCDGVPREYYRA